LAATNAEVDTSVKVEPDGETTDGAMMTGAAAGALSGLTRLRAAGGALREAAEVAEPAEEVLACLVAAAAVAEAALAVAVVAILAVAAVAAVVVLAAEVVAAGVVIKFGRNSVTGRRETLGALS
jgi:hypothetical protein